MKNAERSPRWFSTDTNCSTDGRYFTSTRNSPLAAPPGPGDTWKSGEKSSRPRSEEHTSELQSQSNLVCRLLLEKKKTTQKLIARRHDAQGQRGHLRPRAEAAVTLP